MRKGGGKASPGWVGSFTPRARYKYFQAYGLIFLQLLSLHDLRLVALIVYLMSRSHCSVVPACLREGTGVRVLLTCDHALFIFGGMAFDGAKRWYYLVYVVPLIAALTASVSSGSGSKGAGPRPSTAAALTIPAGDANWRNALPHPQRRL